MFLLFVRYLHGGAGASPCRLQWCDLRSIYNFIWRITCKERPKIAENDRKNDRNDRKNDRNDRKNDRNDCKNDRNDLYYE